MIDALDKPILAAALSSNNIAYMVQSQLQFLNYLRPPEIRPTIPDRVYRDNITLWDDILSQRLRASAIIRLQDFFLFEWFPRSPGLYHTTYARYAREEAEQHLIHDQDGSRAWRLPEHERLDEMKVYDPHGKFSMLKGGVGSIRLKPQPSPTGDLWFWTASSTLIAHQGFPVALPQLLYEQCIDSVATNGFLSGTVIGKLCFLPTSLTTLFDDYEEVPQLYLLVEQVIPTVAPRQRDEIPRVSVAVSFESTFEGKSKMYASFVTFYPNRPETLKQAVDWMEDTYVKGLYKGRVVTDFDEQMRRFEGAVFSLSKVMKAELDQSEVRALIKSIYPFLDGEGLNRMLRDMNLTIINTGGGDFIGRDSYDIGYISNSSAVAIGPNSSTSVSTDLSSDTTQDSIEGD